MAGFPIVSPPWGACINRWVAWRWFGVASVQNTISGRLALWPAKMASGRRFSKGLHRPVRFWRRSTSSTIWRNLARAALEIVTKPRHNLHMLCYLFGGCVFLSWPAWAACLFETISTVWVVFVCVRVCVLHSSSRLLWYILALFYSHPNMLGVTRKDVEKTEDHVAGWDQTAYEKDWKTQQQYIQLDVIQYLNIL